MHHTTVSTQRKNLEETGHVANLATSVDTMGREQPRQRKPVTIFNPTKREERAIQNPAVVERMAEGIGEIHRFVNIIHAK